MPKHPYVDGRGTVVRCYESLWSDYVGLALVTASLQTAESLN